MKKIIKILFILSLVSFTSGQTAEELKDSPVVFIKAQKEHEQVKPEYIYKILENVIFLAQFFL